PADRSGLLPILSLRVLYYNRENDKGAPPASAPEGTRTEDHMADREERRAQAAKHEALMRGACASDTEATVAAATVYEDGEGRTLPVPQAAFEETEMVVTTAFAPEALVRFGKG